jgi:hypothetical protein
MVPFISSTVITLAFSMAKISLALSTSSSAYDIVFTYSFVYPSGFGDLFAFRHLSVYEASKLIVSDPAFQPCTGVNSRTLVKHPCIEEEDHVGDIVSTVAMVRVMPTVFTEAR